MDQIYYIAAPGRSLLLSETGYYSTTLLPPEKLSEDVKSRKPDDWNKTTAKDALFLIAANKSRVRASVKADHSIFPVFHMTDLSYTAACDTTKRLLAAFRDGNVYLIQYKNLLPEDMARVMEHSSFPSNDDELARIMLQAEMLI